MDTIGGYQKNVELDHTGLPVLNASSKEEIHAVYSEVLLKFNDISHGVGKTIITTARLIWIPLDPNQTSYGFPLVGMVLHAISRDKTLCEFPCIFIQLQGDSADKEEEEIPIVILAPTDPELVEGMFESISQMNALISPEQTDSENESESELTFGGPIADMG